MKQIEARSSDGPASVLVSVIVPTHRRQIYLGDALRSVAAQTYRHFEAIVVNDGPEDRQAVEHAIEELGDKRFRAIHHERNLGAAAARNTGARAAVGEILAFLDDDDSWLPSKLERHVAVHQARPDIALVYSGFVKKWVDAIWPDLVCEAQALPENVTLAMQEHLFCPEHTSLITARRQSFEEVGGFDDTFRQHEDWDLYYRLSPLGFADIPEPLVVVRQHLDDRLTTAYEERREATEKLVEKWSALNGEEFLAYYPPLAILSTAQNLALRGQRLHALRTLLSPRCWEADVHLLCRETAKTAMIILLGREASGRVMGWYREAKLQRASRRRRRQPVTGRGRTA